jgi:4'-phosphopantetheinyl transferase
MLDKIHFVCPSSIQHRESSIAFSRRPLDAAPFARFWEKPTHPTPAIYPVILPVPPAVRELPPRERVRALSRHAREALARSAERLGVVLGTLEKDDRGAPLPCAGWFWSLTHKPLYVGGVVAPRPVGIDLEHLRPVSPGLFRRTAAPEEWALLAAAGWPDGFFRFWTAKEAVIKTGGEGIRDLSRCRVARVESTARLVADYGGRRWTVDQAAFDGHLAAVATDGLPVRWVLPD